MINGKYYDNITCPKCRFRHPAHLGCIDAVFHAYAERLEREHLASQQRTPPDRRLVIIESPYAGDVDANAEYARRCVRASLLRGEAPIASHLLYTQPGILNDSLPEERQQGIDAGLAWLTVAHASVVYTDRGISQGMIYGIEKAKMSGLPVEYRTLAAESQAMGLYD